MKTQITNLLLYNEKYLKDGKVGLIPTKKPVVKELPTGISKYQ